MEVTRTEAQQELARILGSAQFATAKRSRQLLEHIVARWLHADAEAINEYSIALDVFRRDATFDPRLDTIVRTEAHRLRARLSEYYADEGAGSSVQIRLRRRSFAPEITRKATEWWAPSLASAPTRPINHLAVLPFHIDAAAAGAGAGMHFDLHAELSGLPGLRLAPLVVHDNGFPSDNAEMIATGVIRRSGDMMLTIVELSDAAARRSLWTGRYEIRAGRGLARLREMTRSIAHDLGAQLIGRTCEVSETLGLGDQDYLGQLFKVRFQVQFRSQSPRSLVSAITHFETALDRYPESRTAQQGYALSLSAYLAVTPAAAFDLTARALARIDGGDAHSDMATELYLALAIAAMFNGERQLSEEMFGGAADAGGDTAQLLTAQAMFLLHTGETKAALETALRGRHHAPFSAFATAVVAMCFFRLGRFDAARAEAERSLSIAPDFSMGQTLLIDLCFVTGRNEAGLAHARRACASADGHPLILSRLACGYALNGNGEEAGRILSHLIDQGSADETNRAAPAIAQIYATLGNAGKARHWLTVANRQRTLDTLVGGGPFFKKIGEPSVPLLFQRDGLLQ